MRFWILLLLLSSIRGLSQDLLRFPAEILSVRKSQDENRIALTTPDSVYLIGTSDLRVLKKWKHGLSFPSVMGFHPTNSDILILQQNILAPLLVPGLSAYTRLQQHQDHEKPWQESVNDSLSIWSITEIKKLRSAPGNFYLQYGKGTNVLCGALNRIGSLGYFMDSCELYSQQGDLMKRSSWPRACRKILADEAGKSIAVSWYDPFAPLGRSYSFTIHDFQTHATTLELTGLANLPKDFIFSPSGKRIAISGDFSKENKPTIRIYETISAQLILEIPETGGQIQFSSDDRYLEFLNERGIWIEWDLIHNKKNRTIWSNLTGLFSFQNVVALSEKLIFTGNAWSGTPMASTSFHQLESAGRNDLELFSTIDQPSTSPLTDTSRFTLLMNDVNPGNSDPVIRFSTDRSLFTAVTQGQLQVWDAIRRKKIFQRPFSESIQAYPDRSGKSILILEKKGQMTFSEYRLHRITLNENEIFFSGVLGDSDTTLHGSTTACHCLPDPQKDQAWICIDGTENIWNIEGKELKQSIRYRSPNTKVLSLQADDKGTIWWQTTDVKENRSIWKSDGRSVKIDLTLPREDENWVPGASGYWTWDGDKDKTIEYWENNRLVRTDTLAGPVKKAEIYPDEDRLMVQYEKNSYDGWQILTQAGKTEARNTKWISAKLYPLRNRTILIENEGLFSLPDDETNTLDWSITSPRIFSTTNFSISAGGRYLLLNNTIIDLKEIAQIKTDKYQAIELLEDTGSLRWIEIVEDRNILTGKSRFSLMRIENNGADTIRSKQWFSPEVEATAYFTQTLTASPDRKWAITNSQSGFLDSETPPAPILWNTRTLQGVQIKVEKGPYAAYFSEDGKSLIVRSILPIYDALSMTLGQQPRQKEWISYYSLDPLKKIRHVERVVKLGSTWPEGEDQYQIESRNVNWFKNQKDSTRLYKRFYSRDYLKRVVFHPASGLLIAATDKGSIHIWDREGNASPIKTISLHQAAVMRMEIRGDRLYTLGEDGSIAMLNIPEQKILVQILTIKKKDEVSMVFYTPDGHYRADAGISTMAHFVNKGDLYPLSSFDYQGNRPDKVYASMGLSDSSFLALLRNSWEARLKRAGIPLLEKPNVSTYPKVDWNRQWVRTFTKDSLFRISASVHDPVSKNERVLIRVNGVPIGAQNGIKIVLQDHQATIDQSFILNEGKNRISIQALSETGQESVEQEFEVLYQPLEQKKKRIFYAGIGVSQYADSNYNLRFAAKDVHDIAEKLDDYLDSVHSITLTNEQAKKINILALHEWLKQANTEDIVIVSLSGHGVLDANKGFLYAPHEMSFDKPEINGISLEELEGLLDNIPARRRLLLIDACHSGETWSDNTTNTSPLPPGVTVTPRGFIAERTESTAVKKQAFLLMKELFSDLTRGNGAFMISAAGSTEFAFEGDQWKNGVFTRSLLEALRELRYGSTDDPSNTIPISTLRKKIYEKVKILTRGRQNPTSRQENGWWDWSIW